MPTVCLQDVLDSKNSAIKDLQYELARVCKVSSRSLCSSLLCHHVAPSVVSVVVYGELSYLWWGDLLGSFSDGLRIKTILQYTSRPEV